MTLKDLRDDKHDPLEIYYGDDEQKDKKKKKKKGKKKKHDKDDRSMSSRDAYKESLKELSRSQLHDRLIELGVDTRSIDTDSKKAMRKAIVKKVYGNNDVLPAGPTKTKSDKKSRRQDSKAIQSRKDLPPHYYDEDTRDFVIRDAMDAPDMTCFEAMQSLGAMRKGRRKDDGFGELMSRLADKLASAALEDTKATHPKDIIDVTDFRVVDDDSKSETETKELVVQQTQRKTNTNHRKN